MSFEDVVVVIPGITGSVLEKPDGERWALTGSAVAKAIRSLGTSVFDLRLADDDAQLPHAPDGVRATALLDDLHILPGLWRVDGYGALEKRLRRRLKLVPGENLHTFPYDWRRDNRAASRRLAAESQVWLDQQRARGAADPKLILVCHSMGGLVARYFLECLGGWQHTRRLVTFGTPYRGSLKAVDGLTNGVRKSFIELGPVTEMLRSFPSVHQLLPIYPCLDDGSGALRRVRELPGGLPGADPDLVADATAFHDEIVAAQQANDGLDEYHDSGYSIHPVVGIEQATQQSGRLDGTRIEMIERHDGRDLKGDGTVPYVSSFPQEWVDAADAMFVATKHASMHNRPDGLAQVEGILRGSSVDLTAFRDAAAHWVALDNDDLYAVGDLEITVRTSGATAPVLSMASLDDTAAPITGNVQSSSSDEAGASHRCIFANVPAGAWRLEAETAEARISDSLLVIE